MSTLNSCLITDNDLSTLKFSNDNRKLLLANIILLTNRDLKIKNGDIVDKDDNIIDVDNYINSNYKQLKSASEPFLLDMIKKLQQYIGDDSYEDEDIKKLPSTEIIHNELYKNITGKDSSPLLHTEFIDLINDFLTDKEQDKFKHSPEEWRNIFNNFESLNKSQRSKYIDLLKSISKRLFGFEYLFNPIQNVDDILNKIQHPEYDILTLTGYELIDDLDEVKEKQDKKFKDYVTSPFRKFMFKFLLNNLKYKFGVDYKFVRNAPFKARLYNGVVEINQDTFTDEDPFHEYLHAVILTLKQDNPELYDQLISLPEVKQLSVELSRSKIYNSYPEEEALVRVLSQPFMEVSYKTLFSQFIQWLKNLFARLFNKESFPISLSMNVGNLSKLMLDSNRYLLDTNYIKNYERWNTPTNFEIFSNLNSQKALTSPQQEVINKFKANQAILDNAVKTTLDSTYEFEFSDGKKISMIRPTSIVKKDSLAGLPPELALFGTFSHEIFSGFLKMIMENPNILKEENGKLIINDTTMKTLVHDYKLVQNKKNATKQHYQFDSSANISHLPGKSQAEEEIFYIKAGRNKKTTTKMFTNTVVDIMLNLLNNSSSTDAQMYEKIFDQMSHIDIKKLLLVQLSILNDILGNIKTIEGNNDIKVNDLAIFSEMFIHNYDGVNATNLYGGTMDIVVISPKGTIYLYDIKTRNLTKTTAAKLQSQTQSFYGIQQSLYKELLSIVTNSVPTDIQSSIVYISRMISFTWKQSVLDKFAEDLEKLLKTYGSKINPTKYTKEQKEILLKNLFYNIQSTDISSFHANTRAILDELVDNSIASTPQKAFEYLQNTLNIQTNYPQDVVEFTAPTANAKIVPSKYDKKGLTTHSVNIGNSTMNNNNVSSLLTILDMLNKEIFEIEDELILIKRKQEKDKLRSPDIIKQHELSPVLTKLILEKAKIENLIREVVNRIQRNDTDKDILKYIFEQLGEDSFDAYEKLIRGYNPKYYKSSDKFRDYRNNLNALIRNITTSIHNQRAKKANIENDLKKLYSERNRLLVQIRNNSNQSLLEQYDAISYKILLNETNKKNLDDVIHNLDKQLVSFKEHLVDMRRSATYSDIKTVAQNALGEVERLLKIMNNPLISIKERASYYKFIRGAVKLYSELGKYVDLVSENNSNKELIADLRKIQIEFQNIESKVTNVLKNLIADVLTEYEMETDSAIKLNEVKKIETNIEVIKERLKLYKQLNNNYNDATEQEMIRQLETSLNTITNSDADYVINIFLSNRDLNIKKIADDFETKLDNAKGMIATEFLLPAQRSNYSLVQIFSILEMEINQNYANNYNLISEEIQKKSTLFVHEYNRSETDNKFKVLGTGVPYDRFTAYEKLIAWHEDPNFKDVNTAVAYLTELSGSEEGGKKAKYELVFDADDLARVNGMSISQVESYIRNNFTELQRKYKPIKTLSLISRVKYNFMSMLRPYTEKLYSEKYLWNRGFIENERISAAYLDLMQFKFADGPDNNRRNMYTYDMRKGNFKDYLSTIIEIHELFNVINNGYEGYKRHQFSTMFTNPAIITLINNFISNDNKGTNPTMKLSEFKTQLNAMIGNKQSNAILRTISTLLESITDNDITAIVPIEGREDTIIDRVTRILRDKHHTEIKQYYGNNYGSIFILEATERYFRYIDGKKDKYKERAFKKSLHDQYEEILKYRTYLKNIDNPDYELQIKKTLIYLVHNFENRLKLLTDDEKQVYKLDFNITDIIKSDTELQNFYDTNKDNFIDKHEIYNANSDLITLFRNNPFVYATIIDMVQNTKAPLVIKNNTTELLEVNYTNRITDDIIRLLTFDELSFSDMIIKSDKDDYKEKPDKRTKSVLIVNTGYVNTNEDGSNLHFDLGWDEFESNPTLFEYYNYVRNVLSYLYNIIPSSERNNTSKLDLPFLDDETLTKHIESVIKDKNLGKAKRKEILDYIKNMYIESITNAVQESTVKPQITTKPIKFETVEELRNISKKANYQIDQILQMLAYNALLYKERIDKFPISEMIVEFVSDTPNAPIHLTKGVNFGHIVNNTGIPPIYIDKDANSYLTEEDKKKEMLYRFEMNKLKKEQDRYKELLEEVKEKIDNILTQKETTGSFDYDELMEQYKKRNYYQTVINTLEYNINKYDADIKRLYNSRKLSKEALAISAINAARKVQLTYSLTGQLGNLINGLIQTSIVASGSKEEMDAYIKSIEILNDMMYDNKVLLGTVYAGNILTSAVAGSLAGAMSIPLWMAAANTMVDKMKDLSWVRSRFTADVKKAINMEINYNVSFDIVEQQRAGQPETRYYKTNNAGEIVRNENDFIQLIAPYGFVKRAEKLIVIQNMLIQSLVSKIKLNIDGVEEELSWWDLHGEDGKVLPKYAPYVTEKMIIDWNRKLANRLHKANGNYTSKYQIEQHWWGKLMLVYAKWIPESIRNYFGGYKPKNKDIFSEEDHEGIMISAYKEGIEQYYKLIHKEMIVDFPIPTEDNVFKIEGFSETTSRFLKIFSGVGNTLYDRIIVYKDGNIVWNNTDKLQFVNEYNSNVEQFKKGDITYDIFVSNVKELISKYNIKIFQKMSTEDKKGMFKRIKDIFVSFFTPFDFGKSLKDKTITRNVAGRLETIFEDGVERKGYEALHHANLRRFYNFTHIIYSMFFTKTMLLIMFGYMGKILDLEDDEEAIKNMKFIINRYNQLWKDVTYYSNPVSAFYKFFTGGLSTVKFMMDLTQLNIDIVSAFPHLINAMLGDSEMGDVILESLGFRDPILERSRGITNIRPVNDFVDMIPLLNKMSGIYKQSMNDYTKLD